MIQPAEITAKQSKNLIKETEKEIKKVPFVIEANKEFKIQKEFNSLKESLVGLQQQINAKGEKEFTENDKKVLQKVLALTSTTDDYAKELRENAKSIIKSTIHSRSDNLMREYSNAFYEFKNKIAIPKIFNNEFYEEGFIFRYHENSVYEIGRKFETIIKRRTTNSGMTEMLPVKHQIKLKGYVFAKIEGNNTLMYFSLEDEQFKPFPTPHSDTSGPICLGTLGETNFSKDVEDNIKGKNWKKTKELFEKIQKQFETVNWDGAHHHREDVYVELSESDTDIYSKILNLCLELDKIQGTRYTTHGEDADDYDDDEDRDGEED